MPVTEKTTIYVTVRSGIATVDDSTVPAGVEVRVIDFDSMEQDAARFERELDATDRVYLDSRHHTSVLEMKDLLEDQDEDFDDDEDDEESESMTSDDDESDEDDEEIELEVEEDEDEDGDDN